MLNEEVANHLLRRYPTDAIIANTGHEIWNFKQVGLTPWKFSKKLWDLTLRFGLIYNRHTLQVFSIIGIGLAIRGTMRYWQDNDRRPSLEDLAHHAQSLLDQICVTQSNVENENLADHAQHCCRNGKNKNRRIMVVQSSGTPSTSKATSKPTSRSRNVINPVLHALSESDDAFESYFMGSGNYWPVRYGNTLTTSQCGHISDPEKFIMLLYRNYKPNFGPDGDYKRIRSPESTRQEVYQKSMAPQEVYQPHWTKNKSAFR